VTPPTRKGFGRTLIERSVKHELGGDVSIDFRKEGSFREVSFSAP